MENTFFRLWIFKIVLKSYLLESKHTLDIYNAPITLTNVYYKLKYFLKVKVDKPEKKYFHK